MSPALAGGFFRLSGYNHPTAETQDLLRETTSASHFSYHACGLLLGHILNILWILVFILVQSREHHLRLFSTRAWASFPGVDLELLFPGVALLLPQTLQVHCWPAPLGRNFPLFLGDAPVSCLPGTQRWPAELVTVRWLRSQFGHWDRCSSFFFCSEFCHTLKWNSHRFTCVPHPDPPSHLLLHPLPLGFPSAPGPSTCLMHSTWAGDLFHPRYYTCFDAVLLKHPTLAFSHRVHCSFLKKF